MSEQTVVVENTDIADDSEKNSTEIGEDSTVQKSPHGNRIKFRPIHVGINFYISEKIIC